MFRERVFVIAAACRVTAANRGFLWHGIITASLDIVSDAVKYFNTPLLKRIGSNNIHYHGIYKDNGKLANSRPPKNRTV